MLNSLGIARGAGGVNQQGQCVIFKNYTFHRLIFLNIPKEILFNRAVCLTIPANKRNPLRGVFLQHRNRHRPCLHNAKGGCNIL